MTTDATTRSFTPERVSTLNDALDVVAQLRDEFAAAAFSAPSDVLSPRARAQDYGQAMALCNVVDSSITSLLIVAEVNLGTDNLIRSLDDEDGDDD